MVETTGNTSIEINANPNEISEVYWVDENELNDWLKQENPSRGIIAPWFRLIAENILPEWMQMTLVFQLD